MTPASPFSYAILLTLAVLLAVSFGMFFLLERRWTTQRKWHWLKEWAGQRRLRLSQLGELPPPLQLLAGAEPKVCLKISNEHLSLMQLQTARPQVGRWNVLVIRAGPWKWSAAGLRPAKVPTSLLDLLHLPIMPTPIGAERFLAVADSSLPARALVGSRMRGLLPPDIGLLRVEEWLVLDFSTRPFDPIELERMAALARQLVEMG